jgi:phosphoribosylamine--glycine ligase
MITRSVIVVGSGGREHALARRLAQDPEPVRVILLPGNDGAARTFECRRVPERDLDAVVVACMTEAPDLVVVGPEGPLAAGLVDRLEAAGVPAFGPTADAARLESSKWFAKQVLSEARVPTADAECFDATPAAVAALDRFGPPWVLKADGLAAGKGVCVTSDRGQATAFARECLEGGRFGDAGRRLLLERWLEGEEVSVMAVCDGEHAVLLPAARDFKRAHDGDAGSNTGGMGAYAPVAAIDPAAETLVRDAIVLPVLQALARRGIRYRGVLYCGLMLTRNGPSVVEFNVRFGDPETQVVLPRVAGSLFELLQTAARGTLAMTRLTSHPGVTIAVALVDEGYPEAPRGAGEIHGTQRIEDVSGAWIVYAGVAAAANGWHITGGRAAYVCAEDRTLDAARERAYAAVARLGGSGWRIRHDIGAHRTSDSLALRAEPWAQRDEGSM